MKKYSERIDFIIDEILDQYMYADKTYRPWILSKNESWDLKRTAIWISLI